LEILRAGQRRQFVIVPAELAATEERSDRQRPRR